MRKKKNIKKKIKSTKHTGAVRRPSVRARTKRSRSRGVRAATAFFAVLVLVSSVFIGYPRLSDLLPDGKHYATPLDVRTVSASTAGPSTLGAAATATGWTNVSVANLNSDAGGTYAVCSGCSTTNFAKLTQFGFGIPSTATINGITVITNGNGSGSTVARREFRAALTKDGTNAAGSAKTAQAFGTSDSDITSGSGSDLWGTTWTPSEVNATTFGVMYADDDSTTHALNFDYVTITVTYSTVYDGTWATGAADFKIYQSSSTTWDAGSLVCSGTLTDDNAATVTCSSGAIAASTQYRVQMKIKNNGETTATMDGASEYIDHKNVKAGWAGTSPTLGSCVFNDAGSDDVATATCSAAYNGNDVRITETGSGSVKIAAAGNEGFAYLITTDSAGLAFSNSTSYYDSSIDSVTEDSSKITISGPNTPPTGSFNSASQKTDGTGVVDISIEVDDADDNLSKAKVEYVSGGGCTGTWAAATLQTPITADFNDTGGAPDINNSNPYQVGSTATTQIKTASGSNTVQFDWASATDVPTANGTYCLRLTVNDGTADQGTPATQTLTLDNTDPSGTGALTDGGKTMSSVTLTFGSQATETNFSQYKIFYKQASSGVDPDDTQHSDSDLTSISYNGTSNTTVSGLSSGTTYVFNIWAYDTYGNVATSTTASSPGPYDGSSFSAGWTNPSNAQTNNSSNATKSLTDTSPNTGTISATDFTSFAVPDGSTINGIKVEIERKRTLTTGSCYEIYDTAVTIAGGTGTSDDNASIDPWTTSNDVYVSYGGATDLWGKTWTPSDINGSSFGVNLSAHVDCDASGGANANIDHIRITVYYTASSEVAITTLSNSAPTGTWNSATEKTDGTGTADLSITANDADGDLSKAKVEYVSGGGCTGTWANATLSTPVTATYSDTGGVPSITATAYQLGNTATTKIKTASGANTVDFDWSSATDVPTGNGTYCLRLTVNDGTADQSSPATQTLTIDNVAPTAPGNLTDGGKTSSSVTLTFGAQTTETNFSQYKIFYKAGASGVAITDTQHSDTDLTSISYNGTSNTTVSGLAANTQYVFNIWAYDTYGYKTAATEIAITTDAGGGFSFKPSGTFYSSSIDTDSYSTIRSKNALRLQWSQNIPSGCTLSMYMEGTNTGPTPDYSTSSWAGPYTGSGSSVTQNLTGVAALQGKRFFRYRTDMTSCNSDAESPSLFDVLIEID